MARFGNCCNATRRIITIHIGIPIHGAHALLSHGTEGRLHVSRGTDSTLLSAHFTFVFGIVWLDEYIHIIFNLYFSCSSFSFFLFLFFCIILILPLHIE